GSAYPVADFYAARAGTNAGAPLDGFLTAVHTNELVAFLRYPRDEPDEHKKHRCSNRPRED
ncbi:hypothetical protein, partial [Bosea sp. NPDC055594]